MQYIPQRILPSPLEGFGEAAGTLADAIIKSRERQAYQTDMTVIGAALAKAETGQGADPNAWMTDSQAEVPYGDVPEAAAAVRSPATRAQMINALSGLLPQMKSAAGQKQVSEALTKMIMAGKQDTTTFYDPDSGKMTQVPGKGVQIKREKPEKAQTVKVQEGGEEVTYQVNADGSRTEIGRGPKWNPKEAKQVLLEDESGNLDWFPEGGQVPKGWTKPTTGGKKGFTGRTKEVVDFLKLMDLDPKKAENWKYAQGLLGRSQTDVGKWALQQAVSVARGDIVFSAMDPKEKKSFIKEQADSFMTLAGEMQAKGQKGGGGGGSLDRQQIKARFLELQKANPAAAAEIAKKYPWLSQ